MVRKQQSVISVVAFLSIMTLAFTAVQGSERAVPKGHLAAFKVGKDDIGGSVTSAKGAEGGVWVIAETNDLPTKFVKIVVTDDQGRYVVPELPKAKYKVWVRGYGLIDSKPVDAVPGSIVKLVAVVAPTAQEAAQIYPASYWYALLQPPAAEEFPGSGPAGNGISTSMKTQQQWLGHMKEGCLYCHQLGDKVTREVPNIGATVAMWDARVQMRRPEDDVTLGKHAILYEETMTNNMTAYGRSRGLKMFADWTDRIAKGDIPTIPPPRPVGVERNIVLTFWDWGNGHYAHDETSSDKRNPTLNAGGPVYGVDDKWGNLLVLDPSTNQTSVIPVPGSSPPTEHNEAARPHNPMMDQKGRVWMTKVNGGADQDFCTNGATNKFAAYYPSPPDRGDLGRQLGVYDPSTKKITLIPVCFGSHHLSFGYDKDNTLYLSGGSDSQVTGWISTKIWDETHDPAKSQGWCPMVLDTNGDGEITADRTQWNSPGKPIDPKKDTPLGGLTTGVNDNVWSYGVNVSPADGSVWYALFRPEVPSGIARFELGSNPPKTCKTEYFEPPKRSDGTYVGFNARGVDLDSKGLAWVSFASGQIASFDRHKCKVTNGPTATGQQCPEGWTFYDTPGPRLAGMKGVGADWHYLIWIDQHNILGLGKDVPIVPGTNSDSLLALNPKTGQFTIIRVPYPLGFYTRGLDGRIDDSNAGWKGRALWADYGTTTLWHIEGGEGTQGKIVKFQLRPSPLAD
jgi:hypothetical protein